MVSGRNLWTFGGGGARDVARNTDALQLSGQPGAGTKGHSICRFVGL